MSIRLRILASIVVTSLIAASALQAKDEPKRTCPVCGNDKATYENSPEGVFRKFQAAFVAGDVDMAQECVKTSAAAEMSWGMFTQCATFTLMAPLLRMRVVSTKTDGDKATMTLGYLGDKPTIELAAVRVDGAWRIDVGGEDWYVALGGAVMRAVLPAAAKQLDDLKESRLRATGIGAQAALKQFVSTEGVWRIIDSDRNGAQDYWTLDVAGFYASKDAAGNMLRYLDVSLARADREGWARYSKDEPRPKNGYWVRAMKTDEEGKPYLLDVDGDEVSSTHPSKYAFCAYPAEYGESGTTTYIVNEEGVVYGKDLGAEAKKGVDQWPAADPTTKGWEEGE